MNKKPKYFHELSLYEMFKQHDHTYQYADDHSYWKRGTEQKRIINEKIEQLGGWNQEMVTEWNKFCPKPMQMSEEWLENYLLKQ